MGELGKAVAKKAGWMDKLEELAKQPKPGGPGLDQSQVFEQYTKVLIALAEKQPLLLILDDLHWADEGSTALLFRLGRRIEGSRILILGTYRPEEVALDRAGERHPLQKVLAEFKRYFGEIGVDLDRARETEGEQFVDAVLAAEPNRLGKEFRQVLFQRTRGHPLFTIELLRDMQERGVLVQDEQGCWLEGPLLDWNDL
ncbi:MAG: AAA family ATPase, partial [Anaerolineae bacterium]|nr:AAA family ATPase [Anaerolineae bacterium]